MGGRMYEERRTALATLLFLAVCSPCVNSAEVVIHLDDGGNWDAVGLIQRWDELGFRIGTYKIDGAIDRPPFRVTCVRASSAKWVAANVPPGRYDICLLSVKRRVRIEGFYFAPVLELDEHWYRFRAAPAEVRRAVVQWVRGRRWYENKVTPLFVAGNEGRARVFVQLLRDRPTSADGLLGQPVATLRYELWQFDKRFGVWDQERTTKVLYRLRMPRLELRQWTWLWDPRLGGVSVVEPRTDFRYRVPGKSSGQVGGLLKGALPLSAVPEWRER